jgi:NAD(P)-dependent dehydrogenase (short-subunit alcohol dehydrogenase family)
VTGTSADPGGRPPGTPRGSLAGKVAVVTGGASGIGAGSVERLVADGASVVVADIQADAGKALVDRLGPATRFVLTDVTCEPDVEAAVSAAVGAFGRLDLMFANAGIIGAYGSIANTRISDVDLTLAVDLKGPLIAMKHAARVMIAQGSGVILATSSPAGIVGGVGAHAYSAAKAGIIGLVKSVAAELRRYNIRVNAIVPGAIVSAMTADLVTGDASALDQAAEILGRDALLPGQPGQPADIAAVVSFLASDDARFITGHTMSVDAGLTVITGPSPMAIGHWAAGGSAIGPAGQRT